MAIRLPPVLGNAVTQGWRSLSGGGNRELIAQSRFAGPMPWVVAIMVMLTVIAAGTGLALRSIATGAAAELSNGITVQIIEADPETRQREAERAAARLRETPGVSQVRIVPQVQVERLIEPWLGMRIEGEDAIPVPAMIDARLGSALDGETLGALRRSVREVAPAARVDAQSSWLGPVYAAIDSLQWLALALIGVLGVAMSAAVILAVRTALGANRETIEIVHLLGGTDTQIARVFQHSVGIDAAGGGLIGFGLGFAVVFLIGRQFADLGTGLFDGAGFGVLDWAVLVLVPVAGAVLAMVTARLTVLRVLRRML